MGSVNKLGAEPGRAGQFGAGQFGAAGWRTSSRCAHGDCVEVGARPAAVVVVRDTKDHGTGPSLAFTPGAWRLFVTGLKHGASLR